MPGPVSPRGALAFGTKSLHFYARASPNCRMLSTPGPAPRRATAPQAPPPHLSPSAPWGQLQGDDHTPRPRGTEWLWTSFCPLSGLPAHTPFREPATPRPPAPGDRASLHSAAPPHKLACTRLTERWSALRAAEARPLSPSRCAQADGQPKHTRMGVTGPGRAHTGCTLRGHEHCQVDLGSGSGGPPLNALRCDSLPNQHHRNGRWQQASKCRLPGTRSQDPAGISPQPRSDAPFPQKVWAGGSGSTSGHSCRHSPRLRWPWRTLGGRLC